MAKNYQIDINQGSTLKNILLFSLPLMGQGILQLLFNAADLIVVSKFDGPDSMGAVGATSSLINLIINLFVGLSVGANVIVAKDFGSKKQREISSSVHTSMLLSIISGFVLSIIGIGCSRFFLIWMDTDKDILPLATIYLRFYFSGILATMIYNFGAAILRAIGDTRRPMFFLIISGGINVVLNLLFVIVFKMGVAGIGLATSLSQCVAAFLIVIALMKEKSEVHLDLKKLHINQTKFIQILKTGLPAGIQGCLFSFSNVVIQSSVNSFGKIVVAGNSAAQSIEGFIYISMNSFSQAAITFCSQAYGAKDMKMIKKVLCLTAVCTTVVGLVMGNLTAFFAEDFIRLYSHNNPPDLQVFAGKRRLQIISSTYALCGLMEVMVGALRGIGYSVLPMIVSLLGACGIRLLWLATIFQVERFHCIETIYFSYPLSWFITFIVHVICFVVAYRKAKKSVNSF